MGRRTLTASELTFHKKWPGKSPASFAPCDLAGEDLLDIFETWISKLSIADTHDQERQNWVKVENVMRYAPRVVLVQLSVGSYGEPGDIIETGTGRSVFHMDDSQAPTGENRAVLMVPATGESAFLLAEESARGSAGGRILRLFKSYFSQYTSTITMKTETVTESEAWSQHAALKEVEVRIKGRSTDIADGPHVEVGTLSHIARPHRQAFFPQGLLPQLHKRRVVGQVVGIGEVPDDADVYVALESEGRRKKFMLGTEGAPAIREVLNAPDEPTLDSKTLVATCADKVSDLLGRTGGTWDSKWSNPSGG
jgi:hypothetical protein